MTLDEILLAVCMNADSSMKNDQALLGVIREITVTIVSLRAQLESAEERISRLENQVTALTITINHEGTTH